MEYKSFGETDKVSSVGKIGEKDYNMAPSCGNICTCACFCSCFGDYNPGEFEAVGKEGILESSL